MYTRPSCFSSAIALFGAYCIAHTLHLAGHELGHAMVLTLTDGGFESLVLNPFGVSYVSFAKTPSYMVFTLWAGAFYGTLFGLLVWFLTLRAHGPFWLPLRLYGMLAPADNGIYLLLDSLTGTGSGDGSRLVAYGVPVLTVAGVGTGMLLLSLILALHLQSAMGIDPRDSFGRRLGILWGGFLPYMTLEMLYTISFPRSLDWAVFWLLLLLIMAIMALVGVLPYTIVSWLIQDLFWWPEEPGEWIHGFHAFILFVLGIATVGITLYIFKQW